VGLVLCWATSQPSVVHRPIANDRFGTNSKLSLTGLRGNETAAVLESDGLPILASATDALVRTLKRRLAFPTIQRASKPPKCVAGCTMGPVIALAWSTGTLVLNMAMTGLRGNHTVLRLGWAIRFWISEALVKTLNLRAALIRGYAVVVVVGVVDTIVVMSFRKGKGIDS
jgi:hypothetical protein